MHKDTKLAIALQYLALGLKIQPIHWIADGQCSCGLKDCKTPGKHPLTAQGYKDASAMAGQIRTWINRWPRCNLGLTMGQVINGQRLIALDIDPRNGGDDGLAELIKQHGPMPDTPMQLTQSGGQHYLFWTPENAQLPGYLTNRGVEVKTKNHINIYPSVGLQGEYHWEASADLLDGCPIADAPGWLLSFNKLPAPAQAKAAGDVFVDAVVMASLKEALVFIPPDEYDLWIKVGQALKELGQQGFGLWAAWSQLSAKFEPRVMRPKWDSFRPTEIHYQSIFSLAEQYGWVNSARNDQQDFEALAQKANSVQKIVVKTIDRPDLRFPGIGPQSLNAVADLLQTGGNVRNSDAGRMAALMLLSHVAGRGYVTEQGEPVQVYGVLCAPSIGEISHFKPTLFSVCEAAGVSGARHWRTDSANSIYQYLHKYPALFNVVSDFGQKLYHARRQYSASLDQAFEVMASLYDGKDLTIDPSEYGLKSVETGEKFKIYHPALTLFGLMSDDRAQYFLSAQELGRGSLEQYLFTYAGPELTQLSEPQPLGAPEWLIDHLKRIRAEPPVTEYSSLAVAAEEPANERVVHFSARPDSCYSQIMAVSDHPLARNLLIAARSQVRRVASLLAIWQNPETPVVTQTELDYAVRCVTASLQAILDRLNLLGNDDGVLTPAQKIAAFIHKAGAAGVYRSQLTKICWVYKKLSSEERFNTLQQLLEDGDIVESAGGNKRGAKYISTAFVEVGYVLPALAEKGDFQ